MRRHAITALICALPLTGCAMLTIEPVPPNHAALPMFRCTTGNIAPGLDVLWALGGGGSAFAGMVLEKEGNDGTGVPLMLTGLASMIVFGSSAGHGFSSTAECRDAQDAAARRALQAQTAATPARAAGHSRGREGVTIARDEFDDTTTLQLKLAHSILKVALSGEPSKKPDDITLTIERLSVQPVFERCRNIDILVDDVGATAKPDTVHYSGAVATYGVKEELVTAMKVGSVRAMADGEAIKLRACKDVMRFSPGQTALLREFVARWDELAASAAEPKLPTPSSPVEPGPKPTGSAL